jgi:UDP-N-acetylglucosamine--N-acetylmuramyl-(pentapeptide) pyrophosphoryl-undecaprenol N-acetylglucosamine transferase
VNAGVAVEFWGSGRALEAEILTKEGMPYRALPCAPLPKSPTAVPRFLWSLVSGFLTARSLVKSSGVSAVVGLGGYSSFAPVWVASRRGSPRRRQPTFLLEQNAVPGVANVRLARRVSLVCLSWEASASRLPAGARFETTGNPLRRSLIDAAVGAPYDPQGGILVLGGSTGAIGVNSLVTGAAKALAELRRPITHQTGSADVPRVREAYKAAGVEARVVSYIDDMPGAYRSAALVIARAGGTTLSELALFGLPSILVPYPHHKDYHQMQNARIFTGAGAAEIIEEEKSSASDLAKVATSLMHDPARLQSMRAAARRLARPEAAETIASRIWSAIETSPPAA